MPYRTRQAAFFYAAEVMQGNTKGLKPMVSKMFSFRCTPHEATRLESLARQTGRNRSEVLRRLIFLADIPAAVQLLGEMRPEEVPEVKP